MKYLNTILDPHESTIRVHFDRQTYWYDQWKLKTSFVVPCWFGPSADHFLILGLELTCKSGQCKDSFQMQMVLISSQRYSSTSLQFKLPPVQSREYEHSPLWSIRFVLVYIVFACCSMLDFAQFDNWLQKVYCSKLLTLITEISNFMVSRSDQF